MTEELVDYFNSIGQKNIFHLPMTVDLKRFENENCNKNEVDYIAYCGGGNLRRDGVMFFVKVFLEFCKFNKNYSLYLAMDISIKSREMNTLLDFINSNIYKNRIKLLGKLKATDITELLTNAKCLIMTPLNNFDSGGFPTKLGEYLATGNPVICSNVSEIGYYLDDSNTMLIEPNNGEQLLEKFFELQNNYKKCKKIGLNGRKAAEHYFDANKYVYELVKFLSAI